MPQRVVIAGGGRIGAKTAGVLDDYGHDTVVIERDADRCDALTDTCRGVVVEGDATRSDVLAQADPGRADAFAALTGDPETNRVLCERVGTLTDGVRTVARVGGDSDAATGGTERRAGEQVIDRAVDTAAAGAKAAASAVAGFGHEISGIPTGGFDLLEVDVDPRAPAARRELGSVAFPRGSHVVADAETNTVAGPGTELRPGHRYVVAVEPGVAAEVRNLLRA